MLAIVIGLLLTVVLALGIVILVALPNLRQGSPILTPGGHRAVERARQQAKQKPKAAVGGTWHGLVAIERLFARMTRQIARFWAPIGEALHGAMDRLEDRSSAEPVSTDMPAKAGPVEPEPRITGSSSVGHPRTFPPISGPIPEITDDQAARTPATGSDQDARSIDLRAVERSDAGRGKPGDPGRRTARDGSRKVDHEAGNARRGR